MLLVMDDTSVKLPYSGVCNVVGLRSIDDNEWVMCVDLHQERQDEYEGCRVVADEVGRVLNHD